MSRRSRLCDAVNGTGGRQAPLNADYITFFFFFVAHEVNKGAERARVPVIIHATKGSVISYCDLFCPERLAAGFWVLRLRGYVDLGLFNREWNSRNDFLLRLV